MVAVNTGGNSIRVLNERSINEGGNVSSVQAGDSQFDIVLETP